MKCYRIEPPLTCCLTDRNHSSSSLPHDKSQVYTTAGIALIAFIIAVAASLVYYQFFYLPEAQRKPLFPKEVLEPKNVVEITIVEGSTNQNNGKFFNPPEVRAIMGISNKVVWINNDTYPHTVTTTTDYRDPYSGLFDSRERPQEEGGPYVMSNEKFEFLFTKLGDYSYQCIPHPWMRGIVNVVENFA
jgi:plastocyanin